MAVLVVIFLACICLKWHILGEECTCSYKESMSETERSEKLGARKKEKYKREKVKVKEPWPRKRTAKERESVYPIKELEMLEPSSSEDESEEDSLSPSEEEDLEEEVARYEADHYDPGLTKRVEATAPPLYRSHECSFSFCPEKTRKRIQQMFPVFEDNGVRSHQPLEHKTVKELAESVRTYGVNANFTQAQVERFKAMALTPNDWMFVTKACLTMGQYLEWKSIWHDFCQTQARTNTAAGQPAWTFEMLTGQGQWANNQVNFPAQVYEQINTTAIKAWKALPNRGEVSGNLTKIIQGPSEPFSEFVARMMEAAGRIFGDPDTAMPLVEQLIFEQCTKECRQAITPWKGKGISAWMKACREIGGPLTNTGLAAAILQSQRKGNGRNPDVTCYKCGKKGHIQKQCKGGLGRSGPARVPDLCPKCKKGKHWANECRSVKDLHGHPIEHIPKNIQRGPRPQGP